MLDVHASSEQGDDPAATSGASATHPRSPTHRMVHQRPHSQDHRHTDGAPVSTAPKLVIGANGFLGSHVTRQLVATGADVRAMVRGGANTRSTDDLGVPRFPGGVFYSATTRQAMDGCDEVYYCVVDTRAWLQDPSPLFRTNVEGLRNVLDVAVENPIAAKLHRFVFTSTYATVGR